MKSVSDIHQHATEMADQALEARRRGDEAQAQACFRETFLAEQRAAEMVAPDLAVEPTRSVLHRSTASLAAECGEAREAERLIAIALSGDSPEEIAAELCDLWHQVCPKLRGASVAAG